MNKIDKIKEIIKTSNNVVFFGGAGTSTESGIPDFRSDNGLYNQDYYIPPEEILSHSFFYNNPKEFYKYYFDKLVIENVKPNPCHKALTILEKENKLKGILTQNIDNLHELAKSKNIIHLHGTIMDNHCTKCNKYYSLKELKENLNEDNIPICNKCHNIIKPDVVLYEEPLNENNIIKAINLISNAETLIIAGTSLKVFPVAGLINYFKGKNLIIINKTKIDINLNIENILFIEDSIGKVFESIIKE